MVPEIVKSGCCEDEVVRLPVIASKFSEVLLPLKLVVVGGGGNVSISVKLKSKVSLSFTTFTTPAFAYQSHLVLRMMFAFRSIPKSKKRLPRMVKEYSFAWIGFTNVDSITFVSRTRFVASCFFKSNGNYVALLRRSRMFIAAVMLKIRRSAGTQCCLPSVHLAPPEGGNGYETRSINILLRRSPPIRFAPRFFQSATFPLPKI